MESFKVLGLSDATVQALKKKGFTEPTLIQAKAIPILLEGKKDVVGQSQTGTGKTASFALPILDKLNINAQKVQAIILTPTRELALQVATEIDSLKGNNNIKVLCVYGGAPIDAQIKSLRNGVHIVVGTPGRVMDLQKRKSLKLDDIKYAVLDEADEMLNMGFVDDIEEILRNTPKEKNMLLFSATMPKQIMNIAKTYMRSYEFIEIEKSQVITNTIEQVYYDINAKDRTDAIRRIIDYHANFHGIIFCNTKSSVDTLTQQLTKLNYSVAALHGDITQSQREKILQQFKLKRITVLIATDVAARGIDVNDLTHVINYSLPQSPESYVHRIGRTGRAGKKGISITLVIPSERKKLAFVEKINNCKIEKRQLPTIKDIVKNKEDHIQTVIGDIIEANSVSSTKYNEMSKQLLEKYEPIKIISAVLKYSFKNNLDVGNYKDISEPRASTSSSERGERSERGFSRNRDNRNQKRPFRSNRENRNTENRSSRNNRRPSRESSQDASSEKRPLKKREFDPAKKKFKGRDFKKRRD